MSCARSRRRSIHLRGFMQCKKLKSKNICRINRKMNSLINLMTTRIVAKMRIRMKTMMSLMSILVKKKWKIRNKKKLTRIQNKEDNGLT